MARRTPASHSFRRRFAHIPPLFGLFPLPFFLGLGGVRIYFSNRQHRSLPIGLEGLLGLQGKRAPPRVAQALLGWLAEQSAMYKHQRQVTNAAFRHTFLEICQAAAVQGSLRPEVVCLCLVSCPCAAKAPENPFKTYENKYKQMKIN